MATKFYKMCYKLAVIYMAIGMFTNSCGHVIRQKEKGKSDNSIRNCALYFANKIDSCLNPFLILLKQRLQQKSKSIKLVQKFSQKTFCLHYEETLQCLHEMLTSCDTPETTSHVQERLSAPWVLHVNRACNINMKHQQSTSEDVTYNQENYQTKTINFNKDTTVPISETEYQKVDSNQRHIDQNLKGDNQDKTELNALLDGVTSSTDENASENTKDSVLKYIPSDTIINKQTNINVYLNHMEVKNEHIFIKKFNSGKMTVTFEQKDDHVKPNKWKTNIGELIFQQRQPL